MLVVPVACGIAVAVAEPPGVVRWINGASGWWDRHYLAMRARRGLLVEGWRALIWGFHKLHRWTEGISEEAKRAAVRLSLFFAIGALSAIVIAALLYVAVILALIVAGLWLLFRLLGSESSTEPSRRDFTPSASRKGRSRRRTDWLGNDYTEHLDEDGRRVGESRVRKDWLGNEYVERQDADGDVVETSRQRRDWLGNDYTEHRDADGERAGESRRRKDWLGNDYVEHRDSDNEVRGRSRRRRDWLGNDYTEHEPD